MKLIVFTPIGTVLQCKIKKITLETPSGYYTLLPHHVDFVSAMDENIISYTNESDEKKYIACQRGIVVKKAENVTITVQHAVLGNTLDELEKVIEIDFKQANEQRKELNTAMARLEIGLIRGFNRLNQNIGGVDG